MTDFLIPVDEVRLTSDYSARAGGIDMCIWHHGATTSGAAIEALFEPGGRTVSATWTIYNTGKVVGKVPERFRPWTSADAFYDGRALTAEVANLSTDGWTISDASYDAMGRLAAGAYRVYGVPLDRDHHLGHRELYERFGASYATACPGGMNVDWVVELGRRYLTSTAGLAPAALAAPDRKEYDMRVYANAEVAQAWVVASEGKGSWTPVGNASAYLKASGQADVIRLTDAEWNALRAWYLYEADDVTIYANVETNGWYAVGPDIDYSIPSGEGDLWQAMFGPRVAVNSAQLAKAREDAARIRKGFASVPRA